MNVRQIFKTDGNRAEVSSECETHSEYAVKPPEQLVKGGDKTSTQNID